MITTDEIAKLADLARVSVPKDEIESLQKDVEGILAYVGEIKNAPKKDVESETGLINVMRSDIVTNKKGEYTKVLLDEVPRQQDGYVKVKKIL